MGICAMLILWSIPASASHLKDIRIGEYEGFTRIVFELDTPVTSQTINPQASGQLVVTLSQTEPRLKRKIPVERSKHVRSIQFWQRRGSLTTRFQLDYDHFRFEYFPLTNPPRLALDVYPLTAKPASSRTMETRQDESQIKKIRESTLSPASRTMQDKAVSERAVAQSSPAESSSRTLENAAPSPQTSDTATSFQPNGTNDAKPPGGLSSDQPVIKYRPSATPSEAAASSPTPNGLQFYLVIILVAITILILALLLIMLLAKRRWTDESDEMNVHEFLNNQDKRIASINARIKEQFKRYEEAG